MNNSIVETKNELTKWIENLDDFNILQEVLKLKNDNISSILMADINSESTVVNDFDEQFAAGMTSDELMENIAAHLESIAEK